MPEIIAVTSAHRIVTGDVSREVRYANNWRQMFHDTYGPFLMEGMTILDIGSGRRPAIEPQARPARCTYIGLDISADELALAPDGSYDRTYARDLMDSISELYDDVDLVVSWQVLEHIEDVICAITNVNAYMREGAVFIAMLSGRNAHFAIINRLIPEKIGRLAMKKLLGRQPDTVFRAHYDHCTAKGLEKVFDTNWQSVTIHPRFRGGSYWEFFAPLKAAYFAYEDWIARHDRVNLATHYIVIARK